MVHSHSAWGQRGCEGGWGRRGVKRCGPLAGLVAPLHCGFGQLPSLPQVNVFTWKRGPVICTSELDQRGPAEPHQAHSGCPSPLSQAPKPCLPLLTLLPQVSSPHHPLSISFLKLPTVTHISPTHPSLCGSPIPSPPTPSLIMP